MAETRAERGFQTRYRSAAWALERAYMAAPLVLRLVIGPVVLAHGLQKLLGPGETAAGFASMGIVPGMFWAIVVGLVETVGGIGLILGLLTRLWALGNFVIQVMATLTVHAANGFFISGPGGPGIEFTMVNAGVLLALLILGAGSISLDHLIRSRTGKLETRRTGSREVPAHSTKGTRV